MLTTQNNTTTKHPKILADLFKEMDKEEKSVLRQRACTFLNIKRAAFYKIINGDTELTARAACFFAQYFDVLASDLIDSNDVVLINKITKIREKTPNYGGIPADQVHLKLTKSKARDIE